MASALFIFRLAWPFLKELFLGGISLREGMRAEKKKVFLLGLFSVMFIGLLVLIPKMYFMSEDHRRILRELSTKNTVHPDAKPPVIAAPVSVKPIEPTTVPVAQVEPVIKQIVKVKRKSNNKPTPQKSEAQREYERKKAYMDFFDRYDN